ncbi:HACD [Lepeophtheirus salmonis]|uniref:HACD n=1 Tax=Lepeophtheirus salmonis TaxID=72036 RepID=A0A7R8HC96_LEPSM|nr:HACD [Lepeophtheirus salmonis]CAF3003924.1 HACD [Lepeophtheirus salmonis]
MHPNVYWAQTAKDVFLKVAIIDIQREPDICIEDEEIEFCAIGSTGTQGIQRYDFVIEFFLPIDASTSSFVIREREIMISLPKKETDWWPRLLHEPKKLPWLKVDFEKWKSEDLSSTDDDNPKDEIKKRLSDQVSSEDFLRSKYPDVYKDLQKHELSYVSESNRKIYLFFYNLFMFCTYLYIFSVLNIRYARLGNDFIPHAFKSVGSVLKMISLLMFLEVLHPIFGYTKTSSLNAFLTIGSRNFILFFSHRRRTQDSGETRHFLYFYYILPHRINKVSLLPSTNVRYSARLYCMDPLYIMDTPIPCHFHL